MTETVARVRKLLWATVALLIVLFVLTLGLQYQVTRINDRQNEVRDAVAIAQAIDEASNCRSVQSSAYQEEAWVNQANMIQASLDQNREEVRRLVGEALRRPSIQDRIEANCKETK